MFDRYAGDRTQIGEAALQQRAQLLSFGIAERRFHLSDESFSGTDAKPELSATLVRNKRRENASVPGVGPAGDHPLLLQRDEDAVHRLWRNRGSACQLGTGCARRGHQRMQRHGVRVGHVQICGPHARLDPQSHQMVYLLQQEAQALLGMGQHMSQTPGWRLPRHGRVTQSFTILISGG
ncbi:MAG TPA: hypothetical protein P5528_12620 [Steroidobacteraceae bacterium]|nr:hypothetical protein [Steroidobacteraceae bacterium]